MGRLEQERVPGQILELFSLYWLTLNYGHIFRPPYCSSWLVVRMKQGSRTRLSLHGHISWKLSELERCRKVGLLHGRFIRQEYSLSWAILCRKTFQNRFVLLGHRRLQIRNYIYASNKYSNDFKDQSNRIPL